MADANHLGAEAALTELSGWKKAAETREALFKVFVFADFAAAFAWMTRVAFAAERLDHHPEWRNVYNRVEVTLTTHDAGGVTKKDVALGRLMDQWAAQ